MDKRKFFGVLSLLAIPAVVWAGEVVLPFTFSSGTPIRASEMNANFAALKAAVDDLDSRLSATGAGVLKSGARLKLLVVESTDGFAGAYGPPLGGSFPLGPVFWDSTLQTPCYWYSYGVFVGKCAPVGVIGTQVVFSDSSCQTRAVRDFYSFPPPEGETSRSYAASYLDDGGVRLVEAGAFSLAAVSTFSAQSSGSGLPDGGTEWTTNCVQQGDAFVAPIVREFDVSELAPLTLRAR